MKKYKYCLNFLYYKGACITKKRGRAYIRRNLYYYYYLLLLIYNIIYNIYENKI